MFFDTEINQKGLKNCLGYYMHPADWAVHGPFSLEEHHESESIPGGTSSNFVIDVPVIELS